MPIMIDLSGAPYDEACAQLGQTTDFALANALEVDAYRAAIIAVYGPPPASAVLRAQAHQHDFGIYLSLVLEVARPRANTEMTAEIEAARDYAERIGHGLAHWHQACMTAPVVYDDDHQIYRRKASVVDVVMDALMTSRPDREGRFPVPDFATIHHNLALEWPDFARAHAILTAREPSDVE